LIVKGIYSNDAVKAGEEGIEIKTTKKTGGQVDTHGARKQIMCVFVYDVDQNSDLTAEDPSQIPVASAKASESAIASGTVFFPGHSASSYLPRPFRRNFPGVFSNRYERMEDSGTSPIVAFTI